MTYEIVTLFPDTMLFSQGDTYISLYQPTHRHFPDNKQDPIVFKNLLKELENSLDEIGDKEFKEKLLTPFYALQEDFDFWNNTLDGIAVLASPGRCIIYNLHVPVEPLAIVAHSFHIKPLIRAFQSIENFQMLVLARESFSLFEGNQNQMTELELPEGAPITMDDALGDQLTQNHLSFGTSGYGGDTPMYHGTVNKQDEVDKDTERYFRVVDEYVMENFSKESHLPLVLVSLPEYHALFHRISKNLQLMGESISLSAQETDRSEMKEIAHELINRLQRQKIEGLKEKFGNAKAEKLASDSLAISVMAAIEGRVATLLLEKNRIQGGAINRETGKITKGDVSKPYYDDVLDDLAQIVISMGGDVMMLTAEDMPSVTGLAAIFRY